MGLLVSALLGIIGTDGAAPDRAVHCYGMAEGYVRARTGNWKTMEDVPKSLGRGAIVSGPSDDILVIECKDVGMVIRFSLNENKTGPLFNVVDVKWHVRPIDPYDPRFPVFGRKVIGGYTIAGEPID
jgi:hypothetical protein